MNGVTPQLKITVYQVGLRHIRATYNLTVSSTTTLKDLYGMIAEKAYDVRRALVAATIRAYDPAYIGIYVYPGRRFISDDPDGTPAFKLDTSDCTKTITECGITDGAELMFENGEMD